MERLADAQRVDLRLVGLLAGEQLVDRAEPELEPALEVALAQGDLEVQLGVGAERAAAVALRVEQDRLPERGDLGDVGLEVELATSVKMNPMIGSVERTAVEARTRRSTVVPGLDVVRGGLGGHSFHYGNGRSALEASDELVEPELLEALADGVELAGAELDERAALLAEVERLAQAGLAGVQAPDDLLDPRGRGLVGGGASSCSISPPSIVASTSPSPKRSRTSPGGARGLRRS